MECCGAGEVGRGGEIIRCSKKLLTVTTAESLRFFQFFPGVLVFLHSPGPLRREWVYEEQ